MGFLQRLFGMEGSFYLCEAPSKCHSNDSLSSRADAADAVREAWDIATSVRRAMPLRGDSHASFPQNVGSASAIGAFPQYAAGRHVAVHEKGTQQTRDLGEGMERLRLCVSLLQKQVHVSSSISIASTLMQLFIPKLIKVLADGAKCSSA
jgi:hypothetical protein